MLGGNIVNRNGTGHQSIYGGKFPDEGIWIKHTHKGLVSMMNAGQPNTNGSQFIITLGACPNLDKKNTVIGRVINGYTDTCFKVEAKA